MDRTFGQKLQFSIKMKKEFDWLHLQEDFFGKRLDWKTFFLQIFGGRCFISICISGRAEKNWLSPRWGESSIIKIFRRRNLIFEFFNDSAKMWINRSYFFNLDICRFRSWVFLLMICKAIPNVSNRWYARYWSNPRAIPLSKLQKCNFFLRKHLLANFWKFRCSDLTRIRIRSNWVN